MAFQEKTKEIVKNLRKKYFYDEIPDWQGFFDEVKPLERTYPATDFYLEKDKYGNFLDEMTYLPARLFMNSGIDSIVIPKNVVEIGDNCFQNSNIIDCVIQGPIRTIPSDCFKNCKNLLEIHLPETVNKIESGAFDGCNDDVKIYMKKTGKRILLTKKEYDFLVNHLVEETA